MVAVGSRRKPAHQVPAAELSPWSVQAATLTDRGQVRDGNEDAVYLEPSGSHEAHARGLLCIVADGMGGYAAGEVASRLAVQGVRNRYYAGPSTYIVDALRSAIESTNFDVWQYAQRQPETVGMGCTLTSVVIFGDDLIVGHVGDSRAYLVRNSGIAQMTKDHSWVEEQVDAGAITREQANRHPQRNVILRALGARSSIVVDIVQEKILDGDAIVLCSDGLSTLVSDEEIGRTAVEVSPDQAVRQLVALANQRGAPDNVSVAVLRVHGPRQRWFTRLRRWWPLAAASAVLLALAATLAIVTREPTPPALAPDSGPAAPAAAELPTAPPAVISSAQPPTQAPPAVTAVPTPAAAIRGEIAYIASAGKLRSRASLDPSTIADSLSEGVAVSILEVDPNGPAFENDSTWYRVEVLSLKKQGWVWAGLVKRGPIAVTPSASPVPTVRVP